MRALIARDLADAGIAGLSADRKYATAYNAALQAANMAIACAGYRVTAKTGHHKMTFYSANLALGAGASKYADYFETCRRKRNVIDYTRSQVATDTEAKERGPKVLDFGLAKAAAPAVGVASIGSTRSADALLTDEGVTVGTVAYMSPEQLRGAPLDARTDLFSLGLVLYEMATGRPAFAGPTSAGISSAILNDDPVAPREARGDLPQRLDDIILKALEKNREERHQTAADLRAELRRLKRDLDSQPERT